MSSENITHKKNFGWMLLILVVGLFAVLWLLGIWRSEITDQGTDVVSEEGVLQEETEENQFAEIDALLDVGLSDVDGEIEVIDSSLE